MVVAQGAKCTAVLSPMYHLHRENTGPYSTFLYKVCYTAWVWCRAVLSSLVTSRLGGKMLIRPKLTLRWLFTALALLQKYSRKADKKNLPWQWVVYLCNSRGETTWSMVRVYAPYWSYHSNFLSSNSSWAGLSPFWSTARLAKGGLPLPSKGRRPPSRSVQTSAWWRRDG